MSKINENEKVHKINEVDTDNALNIINLDLYNTIKSVCKIITSKGNGTGFLIRLQKDSKELYCLMSNEHVITKDMIDSNEKISVFYEAQNENFEIILNKKERVIKEYTSKN